MGNVEKYGLLSLFVLCAIMIGVGIFGGDGTKTDKWQPTVGPNAKGAGQDGSQQSEQLVGNNGEGEQREGLTRQGDASQGSGLEHVPSPSRDRSFPEGEDDPWSAPKVLDDPEAAAKKDDVANRQKPRTPRNYEVRRGDSFERIARRELGSRDYTKALMAANQGIKAHELRPGQVLKLPEVTGAAPPRPVLGGRTHKIVPGDTLGELSTHFYGTARFAAHIAKANGMRKNDVLRTGKLLRIPELPSSAKARPAK